ncbi:hypothetical protein Emag_002815 [Eimeria magna]
MDATQFDFGLQLDTARLQEFLGKLCRSQEESQERQKELATTLENVIKRLEKRDQDFDEQRQAMQRLQEDVSRLIGRYDDLEKLKISEKVERFDTHHNDFKNLQAQLAQLDTKVKSHEAAVSHVEGRSTTVEDRQNTVEEGFQELLTEFSSLKANQTSLCGHCEVMEARCVEVERRQDELAASVQNKYDNLWRGVEHSLETISTAELKKYHHDIRAVSGEIEKRMNMQISYCLDILARATETNRRRDLKRAVILSAASNPTHSFCSPVQVRNCFRRWLFHIRWTYEVERVKGECKSLIPDLDALLAGSVNPRLQSLEHGVETEARKTNLLAERNKELWEQLQAVTSSSLLSQEKESTLDERLAALQSAFEQSDNKCKELEFMLGLVVKLLEEIANAQISSMHQARRVTGVRLGSGRLEGRLNMKTTPRPLYESELFSEPIRSARSLRAGRQSGAPEPDREKDASVIQCRSLQPDVATAKAPQVFAQLQGVADSECKKPISSPSVAAFAEWVDSVRRTMELKQGVNESGKLVPNL